MCKELQHLLFASTLTDGLDDVCDCVGGGSGVDGSGDGDCVMLVFFAVVVGVVGGIV